MLEELDREIMELQERFRSRQKLRTDLQGAQASLSQEKARLARLSAELEREGADVRRLEGLSLTGLFYTLLGSKDDKLAKERQEYLAAKLQFDECRAAVASLDREVLHLKAQIDEMDRLQHHYQDLLARKEAALAASGDSRAARLTELARELANARADAKELREAIAAASAVLYALRDVAGALNSASDWGVLDMLGGGTLTTLVKHSRIDQARSGAHRVQELLRRFQRELADVGIRSSDLHIDIGSFATFADFFFDGLISDWVVQSRVAQSRECVRRMEERVSITRRQLERRLAQVEQNLGALEAERKRLLAA